MYPKLEKFLFLVSFLGMIIQLNCSKTITDYQSHQNYKKEKLENETKQGHSEPHDWSSTPHKTFFLHQLSRSSPSQHPSEDDEPLIWF